MPPVIVNLAKTDDVRDVIHRAVQALAEGELVALPTETVYGVAASALSERGVDRLAEFKNRPDDAPFALAVKGDQEARDYAPDWSPLAGRLARRCWPGPVTLVLDADPERGLVARLPDSVRRWVCPDGAIGFRSPANRLVMDLLRMLAGPLALTSANRRGEPEAVTSADLAKSLGGAVSMVLDAGPAHYGQPSTVVRVVGDSMRVLREGVVGEATLRRMARVEVLMVCTGNTCRSPMAEALFRRRLAERLGTTPEGLEERGVGVSSAGIAASEGSPASRESAELMAELGVPIADHAAQQVTEQHVRHADLIFTMTRNHRQALLDAWPAAAERTHLLLPDGGDLGDPIGGPMDLYRQCAAQVDRAVEAQLSRVLPLLGGDPI